jgi:death-on-curing protein
MEFVYFTLQYAINVHDDIIEATGGLPGVLNIGLLESVLDHIQNDDYYPNVEDKLTHLVFSLVKNHAFQDGNKRSSLALSSYFLEINGLDVLVTKYIKAMENFVVNVAENTIDKDLLQEIVASTLYEDEFSEELKLKIIRAISPIA